MNPALHKLLSFAAIVTLCVGLPSALHGDSYPANYDWRASDPIEYADIVVEGAVSDVEMVSKRSLEPGRLIENATMLFHIQETRVLRGPSLMYPICGEGGVDWREWKGRRVVLCGYWEPKLKRYEVRGWESALSLQGAVWVRRTRAPKDEAVPDDVLRSRIAAVQPEAIIDRAEMIVVGTVYAVEDSVVQVEGERRGSVKKVSLQPHEVLRGKPVAAPIKLSGYSWEAAFTYPKVGERWIAFLERREARLWVISGRNGFLRVGDKGRLLYRGRAPYRLTEKDVKKLSRATPRPKG